MEPVRFFIEVGSPVILSRFAPQLDSLVYAALHQAISLNHDEILEKMKSIIAWNDELGVFHASAMRFGVSGDAGLVSKDYVRVDSHKGKLSSENFAPNGRGGRYVKVVTAGGPFKTRVSKRLSYQSPYIVFDALCEPELVKRLLTNMFVGVGYDSYRAGQGEIRSIVHLPLDKDVSIFCDGEVRRNVPLELAGENTGIPSRSPLTPPYYSDVVTDCLSAPRVATLMDAKKIESI